MDIISRKAARDRGLKRFFTGTPCQEGHIAERYTSSGNCIGCTRSFGASGLFPGSVMVPARRMHPDDADAFYAWAEACDVARGYPVQPRPDQMVRSATAWELFIAHYLPRRFRGTCPPLDVLRGMAQQRGIVEEYATMAPLVDDWSEVVAESIEARLARLAAEDAAAAEAAAAESFRTRRDQE